MNILTMKSISGVFSNRPGWRKLHPLLTAGPRPLLRHRGARGWLLLLLLLVPTLFAVPLRAKVGGISVTQMHAERRPGTSWVDISYKLAGPPGTRATVLLSASDDNGASFEIPVVSISGSLGPGIPVGREQHVLWDAGGDAPHIFAVRWKVHLDVLNDGVRPASRDMVLIPGGGFSMGADDGDPHEAPIHRVVLHAFTMDRTEVTNRAFMWFVQCTGYRTVAEQEGFSVCYRDGNYYTLEDANWRSPQGEGSDLNGLLDHPVVQVSWGDAARYCRWARKRLPTEAEWEMAARGPEDRLFPWGNAAPDSGGVRRANYGSNQCCAASAADGYLRTAPVGSFAAGASPYGVFDMAGNVWEWTQDYYGHDYYAVSPARDPRGPSTGSERSLRGGSWVSPPYRLRTTFRGHHTESTRHNYGGFRCVRDVP